MASWLCYLRVSVVWFVLLSQAPFVLLQGEADAASVTLAWDYTASGAAGFVVYCGSSSRNYSLRVDVGNTDIYTIGTLIEGATSFCAVTAYDPAKVESSYSDEVSFYVPSTSSSSGGGGHHTHP